MKTLLTRFFWIKMRKWRRQKTEKHLLSVAVKVLIYCINIGIRIIPQLYCHLIGCVNAWVLSLPTLTTYPADSGESNSQPGLIRAFLMHSCIKVICEVPSHVLSMFNNTFAMHLMQKSKLFSIEMKMANSNHRYCALSIRQPFRPYRHADYLWSSPKGQRYSEFYKRARK